uniref:Uncharacterized protein n=1 Tax=Octopus bimaculoides TaxID=37653 RepID=A0A0L8IA02_OCTBM
MLKTFHQQLPAKKVDILFVCFMANFVRRRITLIASTKVFSWYLFQWFYWKWVNNKFIFARI